MTTETNGDNARLARLTANIARMEELTRRLASALTSQKSDDLSLHAPRPISMQRPLGPMLRK